MAFLTDRAVFKAYNERLCDLIQCKAFQTAMEVDQEEDYRANLWLTMMGLWVEVDGESAMDYQSINEVIGTVTKRRRPLSQRSCSIGRSSGRLCLRRVCSTRRRWIV